MFINTFDIRKYKFLAESNGGIFVLIANKDKNTTVRFSYNKNLYLRMSNVLLNNSILAMYGLWKSSKIVLLTSRAHCQAKSSKIVLLTNIGRIKPEITRRVNRESPRLIWKKTFPETTGIQKTWKDYFERHKSKAINRWNRNQFSIHNILRWFEQWYFRPCLGHKTKDKAQQTVGPESPGLIHFPAQKWINSEHACKEFLLGY